MSAENFRNLRKLKMLHLNKNQIDKIPDDTFKNLDSLEDLNLGKLLFLGLIIGSKYLNPISLQPNQTHHEEQL